MAVITEPIYEKEHSCLVGDLVGGYPPSTDYDLGSLMFVWSIEPKELFSVFKLSNPEGVRAWYKVV